MKKRLIITSALMTCLLGASLATGTYAWYTITNENSVTVSETSGDIKTLNNARIAAVELTATFSELDPVDLTNVSGQTYVYVNGVKTLSNAGTLTKIASGTVTITAGSVTAEQLKGYHGTYEVFVSASDRVRVSAASAEYVGAYTANAHVKVGELVITEAGAISTTAPATNVYTFYYSVTGLETEETYNANTGMGAITVSMAPKASA